jgi:hypothetical protein
MSKKTLSAPALRAARLRASPRPGHRPGEPASERASYGDVVLRGRLEAALHRLNPDVPPAAVDAALRKILIPDAPTLVQNNRNFHKMLRDGVEVEIAGKKGQTLNPRLRCSTPTTPTRTTGWRSTSSPSSRASTTAGPTSWCSSTASRSPSSSSRTSPTRTRRSRTPTASSRPTSCRSRRCSPATSCS